MHVFAALFLPLRLAAVLAWTLCGLAMQLTIFPFTAPHTHRAVVTFWSRGMLRCLGVALQTQGQPNCAPALVVCNHISWLDILALQTAMPVVFVAKSEIRHWPVLGWMVALAGTCFIDRSRRSALRGVHGALTQHLQAGQSVCIFPEGTTSDGSGLLPFHAGLFESAIAAQVPVQPVLLRYSSVAAAYIGEMSLLRSALQVLLAPRLCATVLTLLPLASASSTRGQLSEASYEQLTQALYNAAPQ